MTELGDEGPRPADPDAIRSVVDGLRASGGSRASSLDDNGEELAIWLGVPAVFGAAIALAVLFSFLTTALISIVLIMLGGSLVAVTVVSGPKTALWTPGGVVAAVSFVGGIFMVAVGVLAFFLAAVVN